MGGVCSGAAPVNFLSFWLQTNAYIPHKMLFLVFIFYGF
jgi:hypothetical protein